PAIAEGFAPYDRERYFAGGTLLENMLFGKVLATSSQAVKKVNAVVEQVIVEHGLREVVLEAGLEVPGRLAGGRHSSPPRQRGGRAGAGRRGVARARALLKRPHPLTLARAVSARERDRRAEIHQRVTTAMKGRTIVAVVERLAPARQYDRVVVLDAGKVAEHG